MLSYEQMYLYTNDVLGMMMEKEKKFEPEIEPPYSYAI